LPEIITAVPPEVGPLLGAILEIVGEEVAGEEAATLEEDATPRQPANVAAINTRIIVKRIVEAEGECIHLWRG
jgi:hypothetical protein